MLQVLAVVAVLGRLDPQKHSCAYSRPAYFIVGVDAWQKFTHDSTVMPEVFVYEGPVSRRPLLASL